MAVGRIPDSRVDVLARLHNSRKVTYATIDFWDVPGFQPGRNSLDFLQSVRDVDALVAVLRAFDEETVPSLTGIQPYEDFNDLQQELLLADWMLLETRLERLAGRTKNSKAGGELAVLEKCRETLEQDLPLRQLELNSEEEKLLRTYNFFTKKPLIAVVNLDEEQMHADSYPQQAALEAELARISVPLIKVSAQIETEISELDAEDARVFMEELAVSESGIARIANTVYRHLGLISYLTAREKEVHSWTNNLGDTSDSGLAHSQLLHEHPRVFCVQLADLRFDLGTHLDQG